MQAGSLMVSFSSAVVGLVLNTSVAVVSYFYALGSTCLVILFLDHMIQALRMLKFELQKL